MRLSALAALRRDREQRVCCKITTAGQRLGVIIASYTIKSVYDAYWAYIKPVESNNSI
jgi:hypothetical protein